MRQCRLLTVALCLGPAVAAARPRPVLTDGAASLVGHEAALLLPADNLLVPLGGKGKPVPFLAAAPRRLELVARADEARSPALLLAVDDEAYRLDGPQLAPLGAKVFASPAVSDDGALFASIEERKKLRVSTASESHVLHYRREGRWEFERPWVTADGGRVLVTVRDYTSTSLDTYSFVLFDVKKDEYQEIGLSQNFVPGAERLRVVGTGGTGGGGGRVAMSMYTQGVDDNGVQVLGETAPMMLDLDAGKLAPAPHDLRLGTSSPTGRFALLHGAMIYNHDRTCGADATRIFTKGKDAPQTFTAPPSDTRGGDAVVSLIDFLPDDSAVVGAVMQLKGCKLRGVIIPFEHANEPAKWRTLALPQDQVPPRGVVIGVAKAGDPTTVPARTGR